jgi:hypothetical protein
VTKAPKRDTQILTKVTHTEFDGKSRPCVGAGTAPDPWSPIPAPGAV